MASAAAFWPQQPALPADGRLHYMDNLRALAMLAGVVFHAALAYSPLLHPLFPTADRQNAFVVDVLAWFLHLFRMPLFFVVAGFFAALLVKRRGLSGMFRNRLLRVALPFLLLWPCVNYALTASTLSAAEHVQHPSPLLALIRGMMEGDGLPQMPPGTSHLWFLYYLMFFYVLIWLVRALELPALTTRLAALSTGWQLVALPLLLVPALASVSAPFPAPESFLPQFWAFGFYGPFFAAGYLLNRDISVIDRYRPYLAWLLGGCIGLYIAFLTLIVREPQTSLAMSWLLALLQAYIGVWATCACLIAGRMWLNIRHGLLRYLADASYWTYIVHLPILFVVQYRLMDLELPWVTKFALSLASTMAVCLISYQLIVRPTVLARLLGTGRRTPESATA